MGQVSPASPTGGQPALSLAVCPPSPSPGCQEDKDPAARAAGDLGPA